MVLVFMLIFFIGLFVILNSSPNPGAVKDGVLLIDMDGSISEQPAGVDPLKTLLSGTAPMQEYRTRDIVRVLQLAERDDRVKAVALDLEGFTGGGQVSLGDISTAIDRVKKAGKPVYAYATAYGDSSYRLAAHASEIWLNPMGAVALTGPGGNNLYYKDLLDRSGIKAHIYRVGTYKSAIEPYLRNDQSPEDKEARASVYNEYWDTTKADIAKARPKAQLAGWFTDPAAMAERAKGDLSKMALDNGFIDTLGSKTDFGTMLAVKYGKSNSISRRPGDYARFSSDALLAAHQTENNGDPIAVITAAGTIIDGEAGPGTAAGKTVSDLIYAAIANEDVKAIVVRVDSPGGSAFASEEIRLALLEAKKRKLPIVVSMANLAASGGYWIATPADVIFAEPQTITGSIGVFAVIPSGREALAKWGISSDGVQTTPLSGEPNLTGGPSPEFDRIAQSAVEDSYRDFLTRVAQSRGKTMEQVDAVAQGRIWAGGTARQLGLVDRIGGIDAALAEAAKRAGLKTGDWHPRYYEPEKSFAQSFFGGAVKSMTEPGTASGPTDLFALAGQQQRQIEATLRRDLGILISGHGIQANCLECGGFTSTVPNQQIQSNHGLWAWIMADGR